MHHAAVLAFIGWYLIVPPLKGGIYDPRAPLSKWTISFPEETREDCVEERDGWLQASIQQHNTGRVRAFRLSKCVRTSDPRLKSNRLKSN
jgi:hypothetical protein